MPYRASPSKPRRHIRIFLALWKNADRDIQVLREAKAEYAKLQCAASKRPMWKFCYSFLAASS